MLSQWSMSEQDGILRVASTTAPPWNPDSSEQRRSQSFVTELATDGDRLREVGRVGDLGRGEDIYAVRFVGDLGYVVTWQVDRLYASTIADRARAVGQLKIPGYSAYLHPIGQGLLLGIGRQGGSERVPGGVQASLFDVSDPTAPVRSRSRAIRARLELGGQVGVTTPSPGSPTPTWRCCRSTPPAAGASIISRSGSA